VGRQHRLFGRHSFAGQVHQHLRQVRTRRFSYHRLMIELDI
jgi:hypothetical protein